MHSFGSIVSPSSRLAQSVFVGGEKRQSRSLGLSGISRSASVHRVMHTGCNVFDDTRSTSFYARIIVRPSLSLSLALCRQYLLFMSSPLAHRVRRVSVIRCFYSASICLGIPVHLSTEIRRCFFVANAKIVCEFQH